VQEFEGVIPFNHFSAKYVVAGEEKYSINNKKFLVKSGEYIVGNQHIHSSILIDSPQPVQGICIDISRAKIQEVMQFTFQEYKALDDFLFSEAFFSHKYSSQNTTLGKALSTIENKFQSLLETPELVTNELFFTLAECIVNDQRKCFTHFAKLQFMKQETNQRLFSFLWNAKEYMEQHFQESISVEQIAAHVNVSEYHFIRLFKSIFTVTPYQYILQQRLNFAKVLLLENVAIKEVAYQCGFADVQSFSKAFKSTFGITPNTFKKVN
jgi:AraC-like DNA-binding protein